MRIDMIHGMDAAGSRPRVRPVSERAGAAPTRLNIADIARLANVSTTAVSFAFSGRPGLSPQTRQRILDIAREANWRPSRAAQTLNTDRVGSIGVVSRRRTTQPLWTNNFGSHFLAGVQNELARRGLVLTLHTVRTRADEVEVYRQWVGERRVDGVLVIDPVADDERVSALPDLGLPAVVVGDLRGTDSTLSCVWTDDAEAALLVCSHLAGLEHRDVLRVRGPRRLLHSQVREHAFTQWTSQYDLRMTHAALGSRIGHLDAFERLLARHPTATAIVFDEFDQAIRFQAALPDLGRRVPDDLSVLSWDDGDIATLIRPGLSVLSRDIVGYGTAAARALADLIDTGQQVRVAGTTTKLIARGSTGPASSVAR